MNQVYANQSTEQIQQEIEEKILALSRIADIAKQDNPVNILFEQFLDILIEIMGVESGFVKILEPVRRNFFLKPEVFHGVSTKFLEKISNTPPGDCICSVSIAKKGLAYSNDVTRDRVFKCVHCKSEGFKFVSSVPLFCRNEAVGVIQLASHKIMRLKASDVAILECAGKIFSNAMEHYELSQNSNKYKIYTQFAMKTMKDPLVIISTNNLIKDISDSAVKILDLPKEMLLEKPITNIIPSETAEAIPEYAQHQDTYVETVLSSNVKSSDVKLTVHPVDDPNTGDIVRYILQMELVDKDDSIINELAERNKYINDFFEVLSNLDTKNSVQEFCDAAINKIAEIVPIYPSKYIVYFLDVASNQLQAIAHSGFDENYIAENFAVSADSYEYQTAIGRQNVYCASNTNPPGGWKVIVPLIYASQTKGVMVFMSQNELKDSVRDRRVFAAVGTVVSTIMEKQALYDSLAQTSYAMETFRKTELVSNAITAASNTVDGRLEKLCMAALDASGCSKLSITVKNKNNIDVYSLKSGAPLLKTSGELLPSSREAYVMESAQPLYYPDLSGTAFPFSGDDNIEGEFAVVLPVVIGGTCNAALRLENAVAPSDFPLYILNIISSMFVGIIDSDREVEAEEKIKQALSDSNKQRNEFEKIAGEDLKKAEEKLAEAESKSAKLEERLKRTEEIAKRTDEKARKIVEDGKKAVVEHVKKMTAATEFLNRQVKSIIAADKVSSVILTLNDSGVKLVGASYEPIDKNVPINELKQEIETRTLLLDGAQIQKKIIWNCISDISFKRIKEIILMKKLCMKLSESW